MNVLYIIGYIIQLLQEFFFRNYLTKSMRFNSKTKAKIFIVYIHFENKEEKTYSCQYGRMTNSVTLFSMTGLVIGQ